MIEDVGSASVSVVVAVFGIVIVVRPNAGLISRIAYAVILGTAILIAIYVYPLGEAEDEQHGHRKKHHEHPHGHDHHKHRHDS